MIPLVRPLKGEDTEAALLLYTSLTVGPKEVSAEAFHAVLAHPGTTVFGAEGGGVLLGIVTLHILPNVTWGGRPYALIENVVTHPDHRRRGIGRTLLMAATEAAWAKQTYKIMLMTGKKRGATGFYEACGFSSEDKTAMVMRDV
ncbi:MAG: GNAT family N-acetyltransferase [Pseudomonadota bacterium]